MRGLPIQDLDNRILNTILPDGLTEFTIWTE